MAGPDEHGSDRTGTREELRTIGFRLREIQRLLSIRVEQENRRLEADGVEPVSESSFFREYSPEETASESE